jgi:hypothetical protein
MMHERKQILLIEESDAGQSLKGIAEQNNSG